MAVVGRREAGFTVFEVVVAVALLGVLVATLSTGDLQELRYVASSFADTKADRIAAARLETLRDAPGELAPDVSSFDLSTGEAHGLPRARGEQEIRAFGTGLVEVIVRIEWHPPGSVRPRVRTLRTIMEVLR